MASNRDIERVRRLSEKLGGRLKAVLFREMSYQGEQAVAHARINGEYHDQTANLRNSLGYGISDGAQTAVGYAEQTGGNGKGDINTAHAAADKAISDTLDAREGEVQLVVVAGMEYAPYVENIHSLNVLERTRRKVEANIRKDVDTAVSKAIKSLFK